MAGNGTTDQICTQLQAYILAGGFGVRDAQAHPISNPLSGLVSMCYAYGNGRTFQQPPGEKQRLADIALEVSTPKSDLARDYALLTPFVDSMPQLLLKQYNTDHWNNLVDTFGSIEDEPLTSYEYAPNVFRVVLRFIIRDVKTHIVIT